MTASWASTASCSGCTRTLSTARAYGETALTAPSTDGTSMPMTVIAGPDQTREPSPPVPISGMPSSTVPSSRKSSSGCCSPSHSSRRSPATATSPCVVVQRARARAGARAARPAPRRRTGRCACRTRACAPRRVTFAIPRSAVVSVGTPGPDRAHVADHERVGLEALRVRRRVARQRAAADLLVALDAQLDPDRRPPAPRAQRADVGEDVRLRVRDAARRRAPRRAPSARTAARSTAPRRPPARRRSGCRAGPSARPAERGSRR